MNSKSICKHSELDKNNKRGAYYPFGNVDGKVLNTELAKQMSFIGKFGCSCNRDFNVSKFMQKKNTHKHSIWKKYLVDLPNQQWVKI